MAEGQKGGEVKPQGRGQHERGAGPGVAAAAERQTTEWARGKKVEKSMPQSKHTASVRPIQKHKQGSWDVYILTCLQVIFEDPANNPIFM